MVRIIIHFSKNPKDNGSPKEPATGCSTEPHKFNPYFHTPHLQDPLICDYIFKVIFFLYIFRSTFHSIFTTLPSSLNSQPDITLTAV